MSARNLMIALFLCSQSITGSAAADIIFHKASGELSTYPFSESVEAGGFLFLSGQIGTGSDGKLVAGGIEAETHQTMKNISSALKRRKLDMSDVVKCTVFLRDIKEWPAFNNAYRQHFSGSYPARSAFATSGLALNSRVEVECMAKLPDQEMG